MLQRVLICSALLASTLLPDTVILHSGRTVQGEYLGGDSRRVRIAVRDRVAGGAVQVLTKGERVRIPSETRLSFTLQQPLQP